MYTSIPFKDMIGKNDVQIARSSQLDPFDVKYLKKYFIFTKYKIF